MGWHPASSCSGVLSAALAIMQPQTRVKLLRLTDVVHGDGVSVVGGFTGCSFVSYRLRVELPASVSESGSESARPSPWESFENLVPRRGARGGAGTADVTSATNATPAPTPVAKGLAAASAVVRESQARTPPIAIGDQTLGIKKLISILLFYFSQKLMYYIGTVRFSNETSTAIRINED